MNIGKYVEMYSEDLKLKNYSSNTIGFRNYKPCLYQIKSQINWKMDFYGVSNRMSPKKKSRLRRALKKKIANLMKEIK